MSTIQEIESAIEQLSEEQVAEIRAWLFDRDVSRDAAAGLLNSFANEALGDLRAGRVKQL